MKDENCKQMSLNANVMRPKIKSWQENRNSVSKREILEGPPRIDKAELWRHRMLMIGVYGTSMGFVVFLIFWLISQFE